MIERMEIELKGITYAIYSHRKIKMYFHKFGGWEQHMRCKENTHNWPMWTIHKETTEKLQVYGFFSICQKLVAYTIPTWA